MTVTLNLTVKALSLISQRLFQSLPAGLVGRQAKAHAARFIKQASQNALSRQVLMQVQRRFMLDPLKQFTAAGWRPATGSQRALQALALLF